MTNFEIHQFGVELGSSAVIGMLVGYATKKLAKLIAVIVGLELGLLWALETHGFVDVYWKRADVLLANVQQIARSDTPPPDLTVVVSTLAIGAGFTGGFLLGFKRG